MDSASPCRGFRKIARKSLSMHCNVKTEPPQMFKPTQIKTTKPPNTFTAQDAGIYSNAELDQFWNRVLFAKHSETTLQILGKSLNYDFITMHNEQHSHT